MDSYQPSKPMAIPSIREHVAAMAEQGYDNDVFSIASSPDTFISTGASSICGRRDSTGASSFVDGDIDYEPLDKITSHSSTFSEGTTALRKLDLALEKELQNEEVPETADATALSISTANPYQYWECGFGFIGKLDAPAAIPSTRAEFLDAVRGEISTIGFIQNGLSSYIQAINSGEHHVFSDDFLKHQNNASNITIGQLFQISKNLGDIIKSVETIHSNDAHVKAELRDAFAHAQPWIQRTRAVLVSAHVFYKINYVLGSDKSKKTCG